MLNYCHSYIIVTIHVHICTVYYIGCGDIVVEEMVEKHYNSLWDFLDEPSQVVSSYTVDNSKTNDMRYAY